MANPCPPWGLTYWPVWKKIRIRLVLEIKPGISKERAKIIAGKAWHGQRTGRLHLWIAYISFDYEMLKELCRAQDPPASLQFLDGNIAPVQLKADGMNGADYHFSVFKKNPHWIKEAKEQGIALNAWTVNDEETMQWLIKEGFDFITTNEPERLIQIAR